METGEILDEISLEEVQKMVDRFLGEERFQVSSYIASLLQGQIPVSVEEIIKTVLNGIAANIMQEKRMYLYLILIAVFGAVLSNFSSLLQGKQVAETAFYAVYILFFSVLFTAFGQTAQIAEDTLGNLLEFMKVLSPAYFMTMAFSGGTAAATAYYEFVLILITMIDVVLVKCILPAIHICFLLRIANQFSKQDMFSKMAELIRDIVKFLMKTLLGVMMGFNIVQGMVLPITAKLETSSIVKFSSAIPGVGNAISSVTSTVLLAGTLVKNAVGVVGIIVIIWICGIPLLRMVIDRFLFQFIGALVQPVSDSRIVACFGAVSEALQLLTYALFVGCMMFVISIALISTMTSLGG